jgi:antitoxin component YwqK of YwqJK toxin-antitoxin module
MIKLNLIYSKENGDLLYSFNKKNGKIEGLLQVFYSVKKSKNNPNYQKTNVGLVHEEYFFLNGLINGPYKKYDINSKLLLQIKNRITFN